MSEANSSEDIPLGDPHEDFSCRQEHNDCQLYGRFIPRLESGRHMKYQVWVERADPLVSFDVDVVAPVIAVVDIPKAELAEIMKEQAFAKARELLDAGTYENDEVYEVEFSRP